MKIQIDVYTNKNNKILSTLKKIKNELKIFNFSFYDIKEPPPPIKELGDILIFEETSCENPFVTLEKIYESYVDPPLVIITSENPHYKNATTWMKKIAVDYINANENYTAEDIEKIVTEIWTIKDEKEETENPFNSKPISLDVEIDWNSLEEEMLYQMTIFLTSIIIKEKELNKFSKEQLEDIISKISLYITKRALNMGGYKLLSTYNENVFVFYFGDRINLATLSAMSILNKLKLYCIEKLGLEDPPDIKLLLHDGSLIFSKKETNFISSDALNTVFHLKNFNSSPNTLFITENIYVNLNPRIKTLFYSAGNFEGREIFSYYLKFYQPFL